MAMKDDAPWAGMPDPHIHLCIDCGEPSPQARRLSLLVALAVGVALLILLFSLIKADAATGTEDFQLSIPAFGSGATDQESQEGYFPLGPTDKAMFVAFPDSDLYKRLDRNRGKKLTLIFRWNEEAR